MPDPDPPFMTCLMNYILNTTNSDFNTTQNKFTITSVKIYKDKKNFHFQKVIKALFLKRRKRDGSLIASYIFTPAQYSEGLSLSVNQVHSLTLLFMQMRVC